MANFFNTLFGTAPKIETESVQDRLKSSVANPLASYLANDVGKGLPAYTGELTGKLPYGGGASVSPFLSKTVDQLYNDIANPAIASFKRNYGDILENYAGGLSSSARAYGDNNALTSLSLGLANTRAGLEQSLPQSQFNLSKGLADQQTQADQAAYQNWWQSLAENNPAIGQALSFLNSQTSSGTTILSALNPGQTGLYGDMLKAGATAAAAAL